MLDVLRRIAIWSFTLGAASFAVGFFGPIVLAPSANQGPLLGIFITGPLGTLAGLAVGGFREVAGWRATPLEILASSGLDRTHLLRSAAGIGGMVVLLSGLRGLSRNPDRAAAASLVVGAVLLWYAATGRVPGWFGQ